MSISAWRDLNSSGSLLKKLDLCPNSKWNCQKPVTFTPKQFQLEVFGLKSNLKKIFKKTEKT